jgi:hypothetical protein
VACARVCECVRIPPQTAPGCPGCWWSRPASWTPCECVRACACFFERGGPRGAGTTAGVVPQKSGEAPARRARRSIPHPCCIRAEPPTQGARTRARGGGSSKAEGRAPSQLAADGGERADPATAARPGACAATGTSRCPAQEARRQEARRKQSGRGLPGHGVLVDGGRSARQQNKGSRLFPSFVCEVTVSHSPSQTCNLCDLRKRGTRTHYRASTPPPHQPPGAAARPSDQVRPRPRGLPCLYRGTRCRGAIPVSQQELLARVPAAPSHFVRPSSPSLCEASPPHP